MSPRDDILTSDNVSNAFMHESNDHEMHSHAFYEGFALTRYVPYIDALQLWKPSIVRDDLVQCIQSLNQEKICERDQFN